MRSTIPRGKQGLCLPPALEDTRNRIIWILSHAPGKIAVIQDLWTHLVETCEENMTMVQNLNPKSLKWADLAQRVSGLDWRGVLEQHKTLEEDGEGEIA